MKMKKIFLASAVALTLLSSCNNEYEGQDIAGSKLVVSASIDEIKARVSETGSEWTKGDAIGVSDNLASAPNLNIKYIAGSTSGDFTSSTGIYVLGEKEVKYTAYYPFSGSEKTEAGEVSFSIVDENGNYKGPETVDFMYATGTATRQNPKVAFDFKHVMSKVGLNITAGTPAEKVAGKARAATNVSYTLKNVITDGKFNTATGTITPGTTKGDVTVKTTLEAASSVILPPPASSTAEAIQLVIKVGEGSDEKVYTGSFTPGLDGSQQYNYKIDLSKTEGGSAIQISSATISGWTSDKEQEIGVNKKDVLEVDDFLCKDGTTIDKNAELNDEIKANIVGVVYYVGNPQPSVKYPKSYDAENDLLLTDYSGCTNGLAISLEEVTTAFAEVETSDYCLHLWFNENTPKGIYPAGYNAPTEEGTAYGSNTSGRTNFLGYNNTKLWESLASGKNLTIKALEELKTFQSAHSVTGTSSWYIPSSGELVSLVDFSTGTYAVVAGIETSLSKIGAAEITGSYWSSTDGRLSAATAQGMIVNTKIGSAGSKEPAPSAANITKSYKLRFAIAF